ncbi:glycosyltransferase family 2 protein [Herbiconiux daphne]|uniref:Glycosyltransferase n=1 Tax=Herbiconiux daphne TaxID=2970914 RepID=A0ABT2H6U3_9MICO|nr:glycosyltransferase [Herbiconiux daphne]MCS5735608.1 glycosyltransferase [Herbiconiux daphne]
MTPSSAGRPPTLSVVIPSYHRVDRLPALISAYLAQDADEVVVVLDGPHPGWAAVLDDHDPRVRVVELPQNVGLAVARIGGLRASTGDVVLAVDDDVEPQAGFVEAHRAFHAAGGDRVLQGFMPVALPARRGRDAAPTYLYARDYLRQVQAWRSGDSRTVLRSLWGGTLSLPRSLYERAEALKPSIRIEYNEDLDLGLRLEKLGATAHFDEHARAAHHHDRGLDAYRRECVARGHAIADLERRWGERPAQLTPIIVIPRSYNRVLAWVQRRIAGRDEPGALEALLAGVYRVAGGIRVWKVQDGIARMLRRALAMRGYRIATESAPLR